jgi:chemotaxis signal transduction protein
VSQPVSRASIDGRAVLESRARELARPTEASVREHDQTAADAIDVLEILLADERIGVPLAQIMEVFVPAVLSAVPGARPPVTGVIAWRGRVLTVLDLAHSRTSAPTLGPTTRVLVLGTAAAAFGLMADDVDDVHSVRLDELHASDDPSPVRAGIVRGVTRDALVVLDAVALLQRFITTT